VHSKTDLGKWVSSQRSARRIKAKHLTEKRIDLLDKLDFLWSAWPEGWTKPPPGGDTRKNRAIAAKLVYPDLTVREALRLGGFDEEELNVIKDQKHTWRTGEEIIKECFCPRLHYSMTRVHFQLYFIDIVGYVYYKDKVMKKIDTYEKGRRTGARLQIEQLVNTLQGDDEDRFENVFEDKSNLLPEFLEAAEERRLNGIVENRRCRSKKKRSRNEQSEDDGDVDDDNNIGHVENVTEEEGLPMADDQFWR
jgi:hypothetical protein